MYGKGKSVGRSASSRSVAGARPTIKRTRLASVDNTDDSNRQRLGYVSPRSFLQVMFSVFGKFLMLGDSMLRRFAEEMTGHSNNTALCQGGLRSAELERRIRLDFNYQLPLNQAILLISTNDLHSFCSSDLILANLKQLFITLSKTNLTRVILLSVPIIPKFARSRAFRLRWKAVNRFFRDEAKVICPSVEFLSIRDLFSTGKHYKPRTNQFLRYFSSFNPSGIFHSISLRRAFIDQYQPRVDMIHWAPQAIRQVYDRILAYLKTK